MVTMGKFILLLFLAVLLPFDRQPRLTRYYQGDYAATATVTSGEFYHYIEGTVARPESGTRGLLLIGSHEASGVVRVSILSWHHFGDQITDPDIGGVCIGKDGLVPKVGSVSVFWFRDGPDTRMHYLLSIPKWLDGVPIRWQAVLDKGGGEFWVTDAWEFVG